jgi:dienelactone hydrolase
VQGYLAYDDSQSGQRPGILICHEWWGLVDYPKHRAEMLAEMGYVAFCLDMYGKGVTTTDPAEAGKLTAPFYQDRDMTRARAQLALDILKKQPNVDPTKLVVIGYCFGGMVALELARSGADLIGVVTFHGSLNTPHPEDAKNIKGKVLALCGGADQIVKPPEVAAFEKEMSDGGVIWQLNTYGGASHAFTNPAAGNDPSRGIAYNALADERSWQAMKDFFAEIFQ